MGNYKKELLQRVIDHYQPMSKEPLTLDDGREILDNLVAVARWAERTDKAIKAREARLRYSLRKIWRPTSKSLITRTAEYNFLLNTILKIVIVPEDSGILAEIPDPKHIDHLDFSKHGEVLA